MIDGHFDGADAVTETLGSPAIGRERVSVRRRRARGSARGSAHAGKWTGRAKSRWLRTAVLCAGVLLLMVLGLYFSLARQETAPSDGAAHGRSLAMVAFA